MAACPAGHDSVATDYCDVCGVRMDAAAGPAAAGPVTGAAVTAGQAAAQAPAPPAQRCPRCGATRSGRFCEGCGLDLDAAPPAAAGPAATPSAPAAPAVPRAAPPGAAGAGVPAGWSAVAAADRAYYDRVTALGGADAASVTFPGYCPERRFPLTGPEMRIGRRSASRGLTPEIDLTGPPLDPGISRLHAVLVARPGQGWAVIDPGSENGTQVNGAEIATGVPVPLHDGDRIHLGAWTVITVSHADSGQT